MTAVTGTGASTFQGMWGNGSGATTVNGDGASTFGNLTGSGVGVVAPTGGGASTFGDMRAFGSGFVGSPTGSPDEYFYAVLPSIIPHPFPGDQVLAGPPLIMNPRVLMEHQLADRRIVANRALLVDGRLILRVEPRFLDRMNKDALGYFIEINKVKYYWTSTNPVSPNDGFLHEWVTIL